MHGLDLVIVEVLSSPESSKRKTSKAQKRWKKMTTKRKKPPISLPIPNHSNSWDFGEINLINSLFPYSCNCISCGYESSRFHKPPCVTYKYIKQVTLNNSFLLGNLSCCVFLLVVLFCFCHFLFLCLRCSLWFISFVVSHCVFDLFSVFEILFYCL